MLLMHDGVEKQFLGYYSDLIESCPQVAMCDMYVRLQSSKTGNIQTFKFINRDQDHISKIKYYDYGWVYDPVCPQLQDYRFILFDDEGDPQLVL
jgi:hypothetical protein